MRAPVGPQRIRARQRAALVAVAAVVLSGCFGDDRAVVEVEPVTAGEVTQVVSAPARVDAAARQDVAAAVSGSVAALEVADGDSVEAGQVIVRLDSVQVDLAREQAAAAQSAAGAGGGVTVPGTGAATRQATERAVADLDAAVRPQIADARARSADIEDDDQRAAAKDAIDAVEAAYRATRTTLLSSGRAVADQQDAAAGAFTRALNDALRQASAPQRAQAAAAAAAAERQAEEQVLVAPFDGVVRLADAAASDGVAVPDAAIPSELAGVAGALGGLPGATGGGTLRVGAPVTIGQTLFTVFDLSDRYVDADVDEVDAPQVAAGQRATVVVDALPDVELEGVVEAIDVEASRTEAGGVGFPTRIRLLAPPEAALLDALRVGMTAGAEIATIVETADLVVPSRALVRRDAQTVVYVIRDGTAVQVPVQVRVLGEDRAAVEGDLAAGDDVIVAGYEALSDGVEVRVERAGR
jgi:multidrug efflux pump subunit AcrA (membrane-fusion protein)